MARLEELENYEGEIESVEQEAEEANEQLEDVNNRLNQLESAIGQLSEDQEVAESLESNKEAAERHSISMREMKEFLLS